MYCLALTFRPFRRLAISGIGILLISPKFEYASIYTAYKFVTSGSYIRKISRIMEISLVKVFLTLIPTFRFSISGCIDGSKFSTHRSCQRTLTIKISIYFCHFLKHWYFVDLWEITCIVQNWSIKGYPLIKCCAEETKQKSFCFGW